MEDTTRLLALMKDAEDRHAAFRDKALQLLDGLRHFRPGAPVYFESQYLDDVQDFLNKHCPRTP